MKELKYNTKNGVCDFTFEKWEEFIKYFNDHLLECPAYIYRGQQIEKWKIVSKIRRYIDKNGWLPSYKKLIELHKENFKYSIRDRVDFHNTTLETIKDDDLWSLGQHFGLATPLIDSTYSPFIAVYFAFIDPDLKSEQSEYRCIYTLDKMAIENKIEDYKKKRPGREYIMKFITPLEYYNSRLVNQRGLHVKIPIQADVEGWVKEIFLNEPFENGPILIKIKIKNTERKKILNILSRMNISHLNLFPDISGSSKFCNMSLEIKNYSYNA